MNKYLDSFKKNYITFPCEHFSKTRTTTEHWASINLVFNDWSQGIDFFFLSWIDSQTSESRMETWRSDAQYILQYVQE